MSFNQELSNTECPICYDDMDLLKNCVTTECGHKFHCSCLMKNAANNGFSCPMCRNVMAEKPEEEDDSDDDSEYDDFETNSQDEAANQIMEDNVLTSFRMFHQRLDGEEIEEEPERDDEEEEIEVDMVIPSPEFIAAKLISQGITVTDIVKCLLLEHEEYDIHLEENNTKANQLFGALRILITNYPRQPETEIERYEKAAETHARIATTIIQSEEPRIEKIVIIDGRIVDGRRVAESYFGNEAQRYL